MSEMIIEELFNCIDKKSGKSYEMAILQDGSTVVSDYEGNTIKMFASKTASEKEYMIF